jgi:hypothetical protein
MKDTMSAPDKNNRVSFDVDAFKRWMSESVTLRLKRAWIFIAGGLFLLLLLAAFD